MKNMPHSTNHPHRELQVGFKKLFTGTLVFTLLFIFYSSVSIAHAQNAVIFSAPDTLADQPGDTITVPVRLEVGGNQVSFLGAVLTTTNGLLSFVDFTVGSITPATGFDLISPAPDTVRMVYFDAGTGPIVQNGILVAIRFRVDEQASEGDTSGLHFSELSAGDPLSNTLPVQSISGKFTVPFSPADIMGEKWNDIDGDGVRDANEPGLPGWEIALARQDRSDTLITTTDATGKYAFLAVEHGPYLVTEVLQPDWVQTFPGDPPYYEITVTPGDLADTLNFGNWMPASIHGVKWHDLDADSTRDAGEPGLTGWEIWLIAGGDTTKTNTNHNGQFRFEGLPPGEYIVAEAPQPGWFQSFPPNTTHTITLAQGEISDEANFGNWRFAEIHGLKWEDQDSSATRESEEPGLAGWQIWLQGTLTNGVVVTDTTETDTLGRFGFFGLQPGRYLIGEILQTGYVQTYPATGTYDTLVTSGAGIGELIFGNYNITTSVSAVATSRVPETFTLFQNYPNPFNPTTTIKFGVPHQSRVTLEVFDMLGKRVAVLVDETRPAGYYDVEFHATDLSSGVYFYKLKAAANIVVMKKMVVIK